MIQLIYRSRVARNVRYDDAVAIAEASAKNNAARNISGLLLYTPTYFLQVLEGADTDVRATFARIERDPRHLQVEVLQDVEISQKEFARWSMRVALPSKDLSSSVLAKMDGNLAKEALLSAK